MPVYMEKDIIDMSTQNQFGADELTHALKELRTMVMSIAATSKGAPYTLEEFCDNLYVLNWLIEDVEFIDKARKRERQGDNNCGGTDATKEAERAHGCPLH